MPRTVRQMAEIKFTPEQREQFRKAYKEAINKGKYVFVFEGHEMDTRFSAYLIEYWDMKGDKHHA